MCGYPAGSESDIKAPWNEVDKPEKEIEVTVSVTLSKTMKIKVSDYGILESGIDEDGCYYETLDVDDYTLYQEATKQHWLPQEATTFIDDINVKNDLKDWNVDDLVVIAE